MVVKIALTKRTAIKRAALARKQGFNSSIFKKKNGMYRVSVTRK